LNELIASLKDKALITTEESERIIDSCDQEKQSSGDPLYIQALYGAGAWFASIFLLIFVGVSGIIDDAFGAAVLGVILIAAAIPIARASKAVFVSQLALALMLAGNSMAVFGIASESNSHELFVAFVTHTVICAIIYPLYPSAIYRFIAPIMVTVLATSWIIDSEQFALFHLLVALVTFLAGYLLLHKKTLRSILPLTYAAAFMPLIAILILNLSQAENWRTDFDQPLWPSSIILVCGMIYLFLHLSSGLEAKLKPWKVIAITFTILLGIFTTPGVLAAASLLIIGYAYGDYILTALAYLFLPSFIIVFYYALNIDLAHKSYVIAGSGAVLLILRFVLGYMAPREVRR